MFGSCPWSAKFFIRWLRARNRFSTNWKPRRFKLNQFPAIIVHVLTVDQLWPKACVRVFAARDVTTFRTWFCVFLARFCLVDQMIRFTTLRFLFINSKHTTCVVLRPTDGNPKKNKNQSTTLGFFLFLLSSLLDYRPSRRNTTRAITLGLLTCLLTSTVFQKTPIKHTYSSTRGSMI